MQTTVRHEAELEGNTINNELLPQTHVTVACQLVVQVYNESN